MKYIIVLFFLFCLNVNAQDNQRYIDVNGTSEVIVPADQIQLTIQIKIINESLEQSKLENEKNVNELLSILKTSGIQQDDIEPSPISFGKNYEYKDQERKQNGFYTSADVTILLKDLTKYFGLISNLSKNSNFEISGTNYEISNYEAQHKSAYEKALTAAKEKAGYMAKALGVSVGEVLEIDENNRWQTYPNPMNSVTKIDLQSIAGGKVTITRSVRVKFAIK